VPQCDRAFSSSLHSVDLEATKLTDLDKGDGYVRRQVQGWSQRYRKARTWNVGASKW